MPMQFNPKEAIFNLTMNTNRINNFTVERIKYPFEEYNTTRIMGKWSNEDNTAGGAQKNQNYEKNPM